jgi:hypothetical protein
MMHLRQPIVLPFGRPLSALIQARFSTEEHRHSSIDDQIADRPGINQVWAGIEAK